MCICHGSTNNLVRKTALNKVYLPIPNYFIGQEDKFGDVVFNFCAQSYAFEESRIMFFVIPSSRVTVLH